MHKQQNLRLRRKTTTFIYFLAKILALDTVFVDTQKCLAPVEAS